MRAPLSALLAGLLALSPAAAETPQPAVPPANPPRRGAFVRTYVDRPFEGLNVQQTKLLAFLNNSDAARNFFEDQEGNLRPMRRMVSEDTGAKGLLIQDPQSGRLYMYMPELKDSRGNTVQKESLVLLESSVSNPLATATSSVGDLTAKGTAALDDGRLRIEEHKPIEYTTTRAPNADDVDGDAFDGSRKRRPGQDPFAATERRQPGGEPAEDGEPPASLQIVNAYKGAVPDPASLSEGAVYWDGKRLMEIQDGQPVQVGYGTGTEGVGFYFGDLPPQKVGNPEGWEKEWMVFAIPKGGNPIATKILDYDEGDFQVRGAGNRVTNQVTTADGIRLDLNPALRTVTARYELSSADRPVPLDRPVQASAFRALKPIGPAVHPIAGDSAYQLRAFVDVDATRYREGVFPAPGGGYEVQLVRQTHEYSSRDTPTPTVAQPPADPPPGPTLSQRLESLWGKVSEWSRLGPDESDTVPSHETRVEHRPTAGMPAGSRPSVEEDPTAVLAASILPAPMPRRTTGADPDVHAIPPPPLLRRPAGTPDTHVDGAPPAGAPQPTQVPPPSLTPLKTTVERARPASASVRPPAPDPELDPVPGPLGRIVPRPRVETEIVPEPDPSPAALPRRGPQTLPPEPDSVEFDVITPAPSKDADAPPGEELTAGPADRRIPDDDARPGSPPVSSDEGTPSDERGPDRPAPAAPAPPAKKTPAQLAAEAERKRAQAQRELLGQEGVSLENLQAALGRFFDDPAMQFNRFVPFGVTAGQRENLARTGGMSFVQDMLQRARSDPKNAPLYIGAAAQRAQQTGLAKPPSVGGVHVPPEVSDFMRRAEDAGVFQPGRDYRMELRRRGLGGWFQ